MDCSGITMKKGINTIHIIQKFSCYNAKPDNIPDSITNPVFL